ncbi:MAG: amino acid adenylation domain-containing protein, partial [bacterium]|nr:amino acid adenylation domain-containing protein [bacterium]
AGEPLAETEMLLLGDDGEEVGEMGVGEIVVACDYLALGYWQDKESTNTAFSHDDQLGKMYWTGDFGRYTAGNRIKVLGRKDSQVKIRGLRVETGEIESVLLRHDAVREAVTVTKEDERGDTCLCAYYVSHNSLAVHEIREYLSAELPAYMIPRFFMPMKTMPLTPNGKID